MNTSSSNLWRNGPASLIYDEVGIPEDCTDSEYNLVLEPKENDAECEEEASEVEAKRQRLDMAIQSILPKENENDDIMPRQDERSPGTAASYPSHTHSATMMSIGQSASPGTPQSYGDAQRLKTLVFQLEQAEAITSLVHEMESNTMDQEDQSFYSNVTPEKKDPDSNFALVSQLPWESEILWDSSTVKGSQVVPQEKQARAGWIPSESIRAAAVSPDEGPSDFKSLFSYENHELVEGAWEYEVIWDADEFRCQLPRPKLPVFDATDENVVFQIPKDDQMQRTAEQQSHATTPKRAALQPHTVKSKLILGKTGFIHWKWKKEQLEQQVREAKEKVEMRLMNEYRPNLLGIWNENISNDEFYQGKQTPQVEVYHCRHSKVVKSLTPPFIVTHMNEEQLRNFHRPKLTPFSNPATASKVDPKIHYLKSLSRRIKAKAKERLSLRKQGNCILFDQPIDLSARDGTVILVENSEEYPPLLSQVGMASQIINFCRRDNKSLKDHYTEPTLPHDYGETCYFSSSSSSFPFLGTLDSSQVLSAIGNNMYHSPIYWHEKNTTDFLIIRSNPTGYMIRELDGQFVAGQQCPLIEVPEPNSTKVKNFLKEFLQVFVYRKYRLFFPSESRGSPIGSATPRVRMDVITRNFPTLTENSIKTFLKNSSELRRTGNVSFMYMKSGFALPLESELAERVTPEQVCAYYSMLATEQRLKDAGLDSMLALPERGQDELEGKRSKKSLSLVESATQGGGGAGNKSQQRKQQQQQQPQSVFEEELLSAPWNTTAAFIAAKKGKCLLQVTGPADPTGCGEGFSYVKVAKRGGVGLLGPGETSSGRGRPRKYPPKTGGTDADLRKLSAKTAHNILRNVGVPEQEIKKLSRWEIIDLVRTLSTEKVMQGETVDKTIAKFCRHKSPYSTSMNQDRYKDTCQRVFELQNKILSSNEVLSSDEDDSEEEEDDDVDKARRMGASVQDIEIMGKNIERILAGDADVERMHHEQEELERLELQKMMLGGIKAKDADIAKRKADLERDKELAKKSKENSEDILTDLMQNPGKVLKITRTFKEKDQSFVRTEIVRDPVVIAAYLRIRNSKSEEFIRQFLEKAERREKKEKKQKDRMLLGQLQNKAKIEEKKVGKFQAKRKMEMEDEYFPNKEAKKVAEKALKKRSRKCGACGMPGHMKTSKECPLYNAEKIEQMLKKREEKKEKKKGLLLPTISQPAVQDAVKVNNDLFSSESSDTDTDSGSSSSSTDECGGMFSASEESDEENLNRSQSATSNSSQEEPIVKTDGLKMTVNRKGLQEFINLAQEQEAKEQEAKELEVAKTLAAMASTAPATIPRRRISQAERENADYLSGRKYKTTAADRRTARV